MRAAWAVLLLCVAGCFAELWLEQQFSSEEYRPFREVALPAWESLIGEENLIALDKIAQQKVNLWNTTSVMIPMSDGVELYTLISFPISWQPGDKLSAVLDRTPYGAVGYEFLIGALFIPKNYIGIVQDMRGRYNSEGEWELWRKDASDGFDTINWITEQDWSDGNVMAFGISADGIGATCQEVHHPPPPGLKAQSLWVASGDGYETTFNNGAYRESLIGGWLESIDESTFVPIIMDHEEFSPWWWPIDLTLQWNNTNVPAVHAGGWYDIFSGGTVQSFMGYQYLGGPGAKGNQYLQMNPLGHCGGGEYRFPGGRNLWMLKITYDMFDQVRTTGGEYYNPISLPVCFYVMGPDPRSVGIAETVSGNFWTCFEDFPTETPTDYYFHSDGSLSTTAPATVGTSSSFVYDPTYPVPTLGGNNLLLPTCGPYDQTELESRSDVLVFTSSLLSAPLAITGQVNVTLYVSSSANDTDFTVKLTDVYDGKSYNVIDNIIRMRWREGDSELSWMVPDEIYEVTFSLWATSYVFDTDHQIRVDVSSSNYPRFSANLNNGNTLKEGGDPVVATNTLYHDSKYPSKISFPVVDLATLESGATEPFLSITELIWS